MIYLQIDCHDDQKDLLLGDLTGSSTIGVTEQEGSPGIRLHVFFASRSEAEVWQSGLASYAPQLREEEDEDWTQSWRETWRPFPVGRRFYLVPEWMDDAAPEGRIRLDMHSGLAFGTGDHATTQMALEALENHLPPDGAVADIGTGSGILLIAAAKIGAASITGTDNDSEALQVAAGRLAREDLPRRLVLSETLPFRPQTFDFVLINISAMAAIGLLPELSRILCPHGKAVLTGFVTWQSEEVEHALQEAGFTLLERQNQGEWSALVIGKD